MKPIKVLFVCLGNICRSPTAHAVFLNMVEAAGLTESIHVDSAGTGEWHVGSAPDSRAQQKALQRGYDMSALRARVVTAADFSEYDYILGMDDSNVYNMSALKPNGYSGHFGLFLAFAESPSSHGVREVPDPYYGGDDGFEEVLDLVESASRGLLSHIRETDLVD